PSPNQSLCQPESLNSGPGATASCPWAPLLAANSSKKTTGPSSRHARTGERLHGGVTQAYWTLYPCRLTDSVARPADGYLAAGSNSSTGLPSGSSTWICLPPGPVSI